MVGVILYGKIMYMSVETVVIDIIICDDLEIENAVESCIRQKERGRWINVNIKSGANEVVIAIDNFCDAVDRSGSGEFLSTKT